MATQKAREKRKLKRQMRKHQNPADLETQIAEPVSQEDELAKEVEEEEPLEKDYMYVSSPGPTSYEELDAARAAQEQAEQVRRESWTVQDLVYNIAYHPEMSPEEKSKAIVRVGKDFGSRLKSIASEKVEKGYDLDLLQLRAVLGRDQRSTSVIQKAVDFTVGLFKTPAPDSVAFLRKQLKETADALERDPGSEIRSTVPELLKSAKTAGIGGEPSILIEKDATGSWRAVLFSSNNFKDRDGEIIAQSAHEEYVEWVNKNMAEAAPVFATWHVPGTARTYPIDFVGFDNGFLIESCPLTEGEAANLLKMQETTDLGLSIGGLALQRDQENPHIILKYRQFEVSDLPLSRAANPFTDIELVLKEAVMKSEEMQTYLAGMLGEERAKQVLGKMAISQEELRKAGVEEKEAKVETPATTTTVVTTTAPTTAPTMDEILDRVFKELGAEELSKEFATLKEAAEKVPVLEALIKQLVGSQDEKLADMINPPIQKNFAWMEKRASQREDTKLKEEDEEDKKLVKAGPEMWLSEATHTTPINA